MQGTHKSPRIKEILGKNFILVIEPINFDIHQKNIFFDRFGFVLATESEWFRDLIYKMCIKRIKIWQARYTPKIVSEIRNGLKKYNGINIKTEEEMFHLMGTFADIAYYTAVSHDKDAYIKCFSTFMDGKLLRYCYLGSDVISTQEVINKMFKKFQYSKTIKEQPGLSCFVMHQILN